MTDAIIEPEETKIEVRNLPLPYDKEPEKFRLGHIPLVEAATGPHGQIWIDILNFPDTDGKQIYITSIWEGDEGQRGREEEYGLFKKMDQYEPQSLDGEIRERLKFGLEELKLPIQLAVHLAFNRKDIDLNTLKKPSSESTPSIMASVVGFGWAGKSSFLAALSVTEEEEVINLAIDTRSTAVQYAANARQEGLEKGSQVSDVVSSIAKFRKEPEKTPPSEKRPMRQTLDGALEWFLQRTDRPEIVMCDTSGVHISKSRSANIYDQVANLSMEAVFVNPLVPEKPDLQGGEFNTLAIEGFIQTFEKQRPKVLEYGRDIRRIFTEGVEQK